MTKILVTGATGTVGSTLVFALRGRGHHIRALVHRPDHATRLDGSDARTALADFADPTSIRAALDGVEALFLACGNVPDQVTYECAVIDEAKKAGVQRIVKLSARGAAVGSRVAFWDWHGRIERHLKASGVPFVLLQPSFLMTNLLAAADQIRDLGMLFAPAADARVAMIDPRDVAAAATVALTSDAHNGGTYVLTGPSAITYQQVAQELATVTGGAIGFADIPPEVATVALTEAGLPLFAAEQVVAVFGELRAGVQQATTDALRAITGQPARPFAIFARDHADAFRGAVATSAV
jgi:uncharacterized protein YbjT (DUF2867 family)